MRSVWLVAAWFSCACSSEASPRPPARERAPAAPAPAARPVPERPERAAPPPPTEEALAEMRAALAEGRRLSHDRDYERALAAFERALVAVPTNARARCEAGYVAHLAGHAERASELLDQALEELPDGGHVAPPMRVPLAMCLYNAGLAHEAAGDTTAARDAFAASLELRVNATVAAALARVGGPSEEEPQADIEGDMCRCPPQDDEDPPTCRVTLVPAPEAGRAPFRACVRDEGDFERAELTLRYDDGESGPESYELEWSTRPEAEMGHSREYSLESAAWERRDGALRLVVRFSMGDYFYTNYDGEDGAWCHDGFSESEDREVVCALGQSGVDCESRVMDSDREEDSGCDEAGGDE